jgi:atypical dual specificity phosphatase
MEDQALLEMQDVSVCYGERCVLRALSWSVPARGVHALMGPGGVGKSTLLELICSHETLRARAAVGGIVQWAPNPAQAGVQAGIQAACAYQKLKLFHGSVLSFMMEGHSARGQWTPGEQRRWLEGYLDTAGFTDLGAQLNTQLIDLNPWERKTLSVLRADFSQPQLLCVDEPTRGVPDAFAERICAWLQQTARQKAVLFVTHHHAQARAVSQTISLLAGGCIQAHLPTEAFFGADAPALIQHFVKTGGCSLPSPNAQAEDLDPTFDKHSGALTQQVIIEEPPLEPHWSQDAAPAPHADRADSADKADKADKVAAPSALDPSAGALAERAEVPSAFQGPRGFRWVLPGLLAGTPQPGLIADVSDDLAALRRVGIEVLVTLTEYRREAEAIDQTGLRVIWFPMPDMGAPSIADALSFFQEHMDPLLRASTSTAFHCHAGLGRTGTMLAACLIWLGQTADQAIDSARAAEPRYIQSNAQLQFLMNFAHHLRKHPHE